MFARLSKTVPLITLISHIQMFELNHFRGCRVVYSVSSDKLGPLMFFGVVALNSKRCLEDFSVLGRPLLLRDDVYTHVGTSLSTNPFSGVIKKFRV